MPSIIAIDNSLSMSKAVATDDDGSIISKLQLACLCSKNIIDKFGKSKLEHVSLVSFSSNVNIICDFTRNYDELKSNLSKIHVRDRCCFQNLVSHINNWAVSMWGGIEPCTVVVITDGRISSFLKEEKLSNLFEFPASLHFLCLETHSNLQSSGCLDVLNDWIKLNNGQGSVTSLFKVRSTKCDLVASTMTSLDNFLDKEFSTFTVQLTCGDLSSKVALFPNPRLPPEHCAQFRDEFQVVGFLNISDVGNPPVLSRHLLLPIANDDVLVKKEDNHSSSLQPSFAVVLHGALKVENKVAIVKLDENWFGIVYSYSENKSTSNLALSLLSVGTDSVPWIGDINHLGLASLSKSDNLPTFPVQVKKGVKRSYAQPTVAWIRATGLQTDVQKILRSAKKLPEKSQVFYKDLNRLRRAALSFGFHELLEGIAMLLEREGTLLPGTAHPAATLQLSHASRELKASIHLDYNHVLEPLKTDFTFNR